MHDEDDPLLRKKDVAQWLNVSTRTVNRWMDKGLPVYRINGYLLRFKRSDVEEFLQTYRRKK